MGTGHYRNGAYVLVSYEGRVAVPISAALYQDRGYDPPIELLPTREAYEAGIDARAPLD